jgi:hypothetical protein
MAASVLIMLPRPDPHQTSAHTLGDHFRRQAEQRPRVVLFARLVQERIWSPNAQQSCAVGTSVGKPFGHTAAQPAYQAVLFDSDDQVELGERSLERYLVQRLDGVKAHHFGRQAQPGQAVGCIQGNLHHRPVSQEAHPAASAHNVSLADREFRHLVVDQGFALLTDAHVDGSVVLQRGAQRAAYFVRISGCNHAHVGQRSQQRDVFTRMMRGAQRGVRQAGPDADDNHRYLVIAHVDADLFQAARGHERGDGVDHRSQAVQSHASRDSHHVGFGHAAVHEAVWRSGFEGVEQPVADVAAQQHDPRVTGRQRIDLVREGVPHDSPSSSNARSSSAAVGMR